MPGDGGGRPGTGKDKQLAFVTDPSAFRTTSRLSKGTPTVGVVTAAAASAVWHSLHHSGAPRLARTRKRQGRVCCGEMDSMMCVRTSQLSPCESRNDDRNILYLPERQITKTLSSPSRKNIPLSFSPKSTP
jgi:hypothetical protein